MEPILETIEQPIITAGIETMNEMFHPEVVMHSANLVEEAFAQGFGANAIPVELSGAAAGFVVGVIISGLIQLGFNKVMREKQVPSCGCAATVGLVLVPACTLAGALIAAASH